MNDSRGTPEIVVGCTAEAVSSAPCSIVFPLVRAGRAVEARLDAVLAPLGLTVAKLGVLRHLAAGRDPMPLGEIAERNACAKSNVTQLVDRLEADDLVRRVPDAEDRRSVRAMITPEGRQKYDEALRLLSEHDRVLVGSLGADRLEALRVLLQEVAVLG